MKLVDDVISTYAITLYNICEKDIVINNRCSNDAILEICSIFQGFLDGLSVCNYIYYDDRIKYFDNYKDFFMRLYKI